MIPARVKEVLYDSETMLRLVDSELDELRGGVSVHPALAPDTTGAPPSGVATHTPPTLVGPRPLRRPR